MLILYSGSDAYRLNHATAALIASYRQQYGSALNLVHVDGSDELAAEQLERLLKYPSFFEEKKLAIVRHAAGPAMVGVLKRYRLSDFDDCIFVGIQDTNHESCDKKALTALVKAADTAESFEPLTGASLATWVRTYCSDRDTAIAPDALSALLQRTDGDMQRTSLELEKLCAYVRGETIELRDVQTLTPARTEQDEWELSNALAAHDKRSVITALWRRLREGVSEQMMLVSLAAGIRNLSMIKDLQTRHHPTGAIASATGLHPYVVSKTLRGAGAADSGKLRTAHLNLANLDRAAKDGRADTVDGLFSILLSL